MFSHLRLRSYPLALFAFLFLTLPSLAQASFTDIGAGLEGVDRGSVAWGDYDNDGDLDILLTGYSEWPVANLYRNDGGSFNHIVGALPWGVYCSSVAWGDYDNDGDLDILLTGHMGQWFVASVYRNDGGSFEDIGELPLGVCYSSVAWGDYDNDGDLDILLTGWTGSQEISCVYCNNAGAFEDIGAGLVGVANSSVAWGDYDNDGDLDILLTGWDGYYRRACVYGNDAGIFTIKADLEGVVFGSAAWGDYDSDGDLDILLTGEGDSGYVASVYNNDGGSFEDIGELPLGVRHSSVAWGDYDNDGDLDILLVGETAIGRIASVYSSDGVPPNTPPTAPGNLSAVGVVDQLTLSWEAATDAQTPSAGLSYNLRVGTTPGGAEIISAMSDGVSGYRRVVQLGNGQQRTSWTISVPSGDYYWSVQSLDGAFAGSPFASEDSCSFGFSDIGAGLERVDHGSVEWGDYDNDGDLDILLTGEGDSEYVANVYRNDAGSFTTEAQLEGVANSSVAWGDYDNDGDLDILLTGLTELHGEVSRVYGNDGGSFTDIGAGLEGVANSSVAWGDYDNDGDLDILLTGLTELHGVVSCVYRNDGGSFTDIGAGLEGVDRGSVAWGDYDNDGDLDILLTGYSEWPVANLYRNDGGSFNHIVGALPWGVYCSSVAWGDYDNDGDLDILLTGHMGQRFVASVYRNDGGSFEDIGELPLDVCYSSVAWGDYDNDGDLDILLTGWNGYYRLASVYRNDAGSFVDIDELPLGVRHSSVAWGDYDNDGDLDILLAGETADGRIASVYRNDGFPPNTPPTAPGSLSAAGVGEQLTLSWEAATDAQTPSAGLSYNLRVGTTPGGSEIVSAMSDGASGYRRVVQLGNAQQRTSWTISVPSGIYYWSIQAVDGARSGSGFAEEQELMHIGFTDIDAGLPGVSASSATWGDYDNDADLDFVITGWTGAKSIARVYRNDCGSFKDIDAGLPGVFAGSATWGDYDNDADLDFVITGWTGAKSITSVYRNDAGGFTDIDAGMTGVAASSCAWGDYDNDGDLDVLLTGSTDAQCLPYMMALAFDTPRVNAGLATSTGPADGCRLDRGRVEDTRSQRISQVYRNDAGSFTNVSAELPGVANGAVAWGDYDNDGDLDILLTGYTGSQIIARVYRNDSGSFTDVGAGLQGVCYSAAAWGDCDNDGDLDLVLTGWTGLYYHASVYRNDGGIFTDIGSLQAVCYGSVAWGDYDNDGDLDLLLTGWTGSEEISCVYRNDAGSFVYHFGRFLKAVYAGSVAWGDYDNDGDLDFLLSGWTGSQSILNVYRSDGFPTNTLPNAPENLAAQVIDSTMVLSWNAATDAETPPAGLTYNLRVGTTPGGEEICSAMADAGTGLRRIPTLGNTDHNRGWTIDLPDPPAPVYYWTVQAIDGCFAGSAFAEEQALNGPGAGVPAPQVLPTVYALHPGAPNPFGASTTIRFDLPSAGPTRLEIFQVAGQRVRVLVDRKMQSGRYALVWDGRNGAGRTVSPGVYLVRLQTGNFHATKMLVRTR